MSMTDTAKSMFSAALKVLTGFLTVIMFYRALGVLVPSLPANVRNVGVMEGEPQWYKPKPMPMPLRGSGPPSQRSKLVFEPNQDSSDSLGDMDSVNWCNEPHVTPSTYVTPPAEHELVYVEIIQRHHRRTPYAANLFPVEDEASPWDCGDVALFYFGEPGGPHGERSAKTYWRVGESVVNPFKAPGMAAGGSCHFPQLTREGLEDAWRHGRDLYEVYGDKLGLDPEGAVEEATRFRVTNNVITSQVAGTLLNGMFGLTGPHPLQVQDKSIDSLEPAYSCPAADALARSYGVGSSDPAWTEHLDRSRGLFESLDAVSGVSADARDWHVSWDHYFDNLASRLCHDKGLPCKVGDPETCVSSEQAGEVFRLGDFEYRYLYREAPQSLAMSVASFGVWVAELAQHLREASTGQRPKILYRHNVAHDGSLARLLSILQVQEMGWPGMGAEVVFELYRRGMGAYFVRVLYRGQRLKSSLPLLQGADLVPLGELLAYFDGLVGKGASLVPNKCGIAS